MNTQTQYIIIHQGQVFYTHWFTPDNNFVEGMIVIDLTNNEYTTDGITWKEIEEDHL